MAKTLNISVTPKSQTIPDMDYEELFDLSLNGITIFPANEDVLIPWDADIEIKSGKLVLRGAVIPGGFGSSSCTANISLSKVSSYLRMTIDPNDDESEIRIREILEKSNWVVS